ncbi:PRC-barrel-like [Parasponia andersonii]|uniref:PRC-barrel-like n=1 Tax=Parasponia andersonii TaxID=3476 RepID=A0A2P5A6E2_PARAD|nr:PRC-barrel-like [Parasponia andersonii]
MCDRLALPPISLSLSKIKKLPPSTIPASKPKTLAAFPNFSFPNRSKLSNATGSTNDRSFRRRIRSGEEEEASEKSSKNYGLGFREKGEEEHLDLDLDLDLDFETNRSREKRISSELLELRGGAEEARLEDENLVRVEDGNGDGDGKDGRYGSRKGRHLMRRSSLLAKQVISIRTALTLGFVSQLWVDTTSWVVLLVEVRPNLLSGESERFLLEDVSQVGDVVLVEDETVIENEFKMIGLETLVGYKVVTPGRRNIGKVRGYTFNINSGAIESLELDSFGISIIPSSLVSTYALLIEDVLEVLSDAVVVHEAAASRIQRLTKGFLDSQNAGTSIDDIEEYSDFERPLRSERSTKSSRTRKFHQINKEMEDDWELPMDYL